MKLTKSQTQQLLIGFGAALAVGYMLRNTAKAAADAVVNVNEGTPYAGTGIVGTVGHVTDAASGGLLSRFGSFLGGKLADVRDYFTGVNEGYTEG